MFLLDDKLDEVLRSLGLVKGVLPTAWGLALSDL